MGNYYLCRTQRAKQPYLIESVGLRIYSIEELCYYISQNVYLLDETIINTELCEWLGKELGLTGLRKKLLDSLEKKEGIEKFVIPIFQECGYLSEAKLRFFQQQLSEVAIEPKDVRKKMKADYLVHYGMYVSAIKEYEKILSQKGKGRLGIQFYAEIWENMAAAYAGLFRFEEAAECLWESYQVLRSKKTYENYLRILPLFLSEQKYLKRLEEIRVDRSAAMELKNQTAAILEEAKESELAERLHKMEKEEVISYIQEKYLHSTVR